MQQISLRISPAQENYISEICSLFNTTPSVVVRTALDHFFEDYENARPQQDTYVDNEESEAE